MKVENLMTRDVHTCRVGEPLSKAAAIMWQHDCGCVPVVDDDRHVLGMVTDRDICMATWMQGKTADELPVTLPMSRNVWSCHETDTLNDAEKVMRENQVRRLPVLAEDERLVGVLSLSDLVREATRERETKARIEVSDTDLRKTMEAVSEPRVR